ncbi:hypothetical protein ACFQZT_06410 [Paenibacillus sp. GCM10027628]|uniref:hypothetical protein n=1 Tax=Paenibacillus sp. GCM10027628 TaxID=3273413 RepID=UPI003625B8B9
MRKQLRTLSVLLAAGLTLSVLNACSNNEGTGSKTADAAGKSTTQPAPSSATADPMGKYTTPITITTVKRTNQNMKYQDGQSLENNSWTNFLKDQGVNIKYAWTSDASQFENKMNVSIASSDLPDLLPQITGTQASTLIKGDQLLDLKPYLDKYLSPEAKKILYSDGGTVMNGTITKDGKQFLLPLSASEIRADIKSLWIRKDWLDKLHLQPPKTVEDFVKIADAFTNGDPDGNGKADTYGFGIAGKDNLIRDWGGADSVFEMFHAQPGDWFDGSLFYEKDSSGKVVWSGSKPGVKQALALLQDMYKKGYLDKGFGTDDAGGKLAQDITGGKVGMFTGRWWQALWPLPDLRTKDPKADWIVVNMPSGDGQPVQPYGYRPGNVYVAVSKNAKNPEAIVKMINWYVEKVYGAQADPVHFANPDQTNNLGNSVQSAPFVVNDPYKLSKDYAAVSAAIKAKDPSKLNVEQKQFYDDEQKFEKDPTYVNGWTAWQNYSGADGTAGKYYFQDVQEKDVMKNAFFKVPSDLMVSKVPTYKKMAEEMVAKIIYGQASVDEWDKMAENWGKLGGSEILQYVQSEVK